MSEMENEYNEPRNERVIERIDRLQADLTEVRLDVKDILIKMPKFVTWAKLGGAVATVVGLAFAAIRLL
jgi:putative lipase involved disintegration of autophagic bodies